MSHTSTAPRITRKTMLGTAATPTMPLMNPYQAEAAQSRLWTAAGLQFVTLWGRWPRTLRLHQVDGDGERGATMAQQRPPRLARDRLGGIVGAAQVGWRASATLAARVDRAGSGVAGWRLWRVRLAPRSLVVSVWLWIATVALGLTRPPVASVVDVNIGDAVTSLVLLTVAGVATLSVIRRSGT